MAAPTCTPITRCHPWPYLAKDTRTWVLIQVMCQLRNLLDAGDDYDCTDVAALKALGATWRCQGSVEKLQLTQLQIICEALTLDCSQPVCWSPLELEATFTALLCELIELTEAAQNPV